MTPDRPEGGSGDVPSTGGDPVVASPAQQRVVTDVLAWGGPRPLVADGAVADLRARLEDGLAAIGPPLRRLARTRRGGRLVVTRSLLQRTVCEGWLLAPEPYVHTPVNVRGVLGRAAILADLADLAGLADRGVLADPAAVQRPAPRDVVAAQWHRMASDRPGDPRSLAAWMNGTDAATRAELQTEVADLLAGVREVWPVLPADRVEQGFDATLRVPLLDGAVELVTTLDLTVTSRVLDARARGLVVDLRTGQPRAPLDRLALRFTALCATLASGVPPFRWSTFYVTEGRFVSEDLPVHGPGGPDGPDDADRDRGTSASTARQGPADDPLGWIVDRVVAAVATMVGLEDVDPRVEASELRLAPGPWCPSCRRREGCPVAAVGT